MIKLKPVMIFAVVTYILAISVCTLAGPVPDTGQTQSYTDTFGEDSDYTINPPSYTKLDAQGNILPDKAPAWSMVKDNVTGLIWEVKTDDGSIHDKDNTYFWINAQNVFIPALNSESFGGFSDWRLPTIKELSFIVDSEICGPAVNTYYFLNTMPSGYWSSTPQAGYAAHAWYVNFAHGCVYGCLKSLPLYVQAVRGGKKAGLKGGLVRPQEGLARPQGDMVIHGDGTVTDNSTGLMWQQKTGGEMTWESAIGYCEGLSLGGYDDWRLPSRNELQSLVDHTRVLPAIDTGAFGDTHYLREPTDRVLPAIDTGAFPDTMSSDYWSSTTFIVPPGQSGIDPAWCVSFDRGIVHSQDKLKIRQICPGLLSFTSG